MIKIYQKQPIEAEQFDGSQKYIFGQKVISDNSLVDALTHDPVYYSILINEDDPEEEPNEVVFEIGDWVIKDEEDIYAIDDDTFKSKYDELPVILKEWADTIEEYKANHYRMDEIFTEWSWNYDEQELIARAWLDGYQVEA
ncbi:hypothetical protein [Levilactobacillus brevis]|uniref:hypothetical protein n=1 Tax=Levilactobacillus brevis TaxID=1580 RepID=UPI000B3602A1|nr:hypothetical protein [Levilactobacillus brevis]